MNAVDLPSSMSLGFATSAESLASLFEEATRKSPGLFSCFEPATGASSSCRVLFQTAIEPYSSVAFPQPLDNQAMAEEFCRRFIREARFNPVSRSNSGKIKGWEVRKAFVDSHLLVIVWASWVD